MPLSCSRACVSGDSMSLDVARVVAGVGKQTCADCRLALYRPLFGIPAIELCDTCERKVTELVTEHRGEIHFSYDSMGGRLYHVLGVKPSNEDQAREGGDHNRPFGFGRLPSVEDPGRFTLLQLGRLMKLRSWVQNRKIEVNRISQDGF
jgi:hypothetical protein